MSERPPQLQQYADPTLEGARPPRTPFVWSLLILSWIVGLVVWTAYVVAFGFILFVVLG